MGSKLIEFRLDRSAARALRPLSLASFAVLAKLAQLPHTTVRWCSPEFAIPAHIRFSCRLQDL
jgi:hypothetical protein